MAKKVQVSITLLEKGDRVNTPEGLGIVAVSENMPINEYDIMNRDVAVLLDHGTSKYPNRKYCCEIYGCLLVG
jgi:hypothetical protein